MKNMNVNHPGGGITMAGETCVWMNVHYLT